MANAQVLDNYLTDCGKTKTHLAKVLGTSRQNLYKLLENPERCTVGQAELLCKELNIKKKTVRDEIFLP